MTETLKLKELHNLGDFEFKGMPTIWRRSNKLLYNAIKSNKMPGCINWRLYCRLNDVNV